VYEVAVFPCWAYFFFFLKKRKSNKKKIQGPITCGAVAGLLYAGSQKNLICEHPFPLVPASERANFQTVLLTFRSQKPRRRHFLEGRWGQQDF
jgi:hypothetical protein